MTHISWVVLWILSQYNLFQSFEIWREENLKMRSCYKDDDINK